MTIFRILFSLVMIAISPIYLSAHESHGEQQTLAIIKPDGVANNHIGDIINRYETNGLRIVALKMMQMSPEQASKFYTIHKDRPFFKDLVTMMSSGPIVVMVLDGNDAVAKSRQIIGATDPSQAEKGTIRADFGQSKTENTMHGSDSPENAKIEISFFFKPNEIVH